MESRKFRKFRIQKISENLLKEIGSRKFRNQKKWKLENLEKSESRKIKKSLKKNRFQKK